MIAEIGEDWASVGLSLRQGLRLRLVQWASSFRQQAFLLLSRCYQMRGAWFGP
jgi:hypothetical protein